MAGNSITDHDWLERYLRKVTDIGGKIKDSNITNQYGCYTALKLISVYYYSEGFTNVALHENRKREGFDGAVYVDLFAGSGLVKLTETGDYVAGSPICAACNKNGFSHIVCVELDSEKKKALENRLGKVLPTGRFDVIQGNCNNCIDEVIALVNKKFNKPIVCAFVDPEGMEIKWNTLQQLGNAFLSTDFLVNVSSQGILRVKGKLEKGIYEVGKSMSEYYGEDVEKVLFDFASGQQPERKYQARISDVLGKSVGANIPVYIQGRRLAYYLLGYTRETRGGSGYAGVLHTLMRRLENADGDLVKNILDQMYGRVGKLFG